MTARESSLTTLFHPRSIAISGAAEDPTGFGSYILRNIIFSDYTGEIFPISEKLPQVYDFDTYNSFADIGQPIDLAIICSPPDVVLPEMRACAAGNVKNVCVVTKGFADVGVQGIVLQRKMQSIAKEGNMRLLGPNSLGVISTHGMLNATFGPSLWTVDGENVQFPTKGKTAFFSQSGALINAFIEYVQFYNLGIAEITGIGNKADIHECDLLEYYHSLRDDGKPLVVGGYLENITDGQRFLESAQKAIFSFPIVLLLPHSTKSTNEVIYAHTGLVLQKQRMLELAMQQTGVLAVATQQELYDAILGFSWQPIPRGKNVAVVSNAGGGLVLAVDQLQNCGLNLVNFSGKAKELLTRDVNWKGVGRGVVDLEGDAMAINYVKAMDALLGEYDVNAVLIIMSPQMMTDIEEIAESIGRLAKQHGKTVVAAFMGYEGVEKGIRTLARFHIPAYKTVHRAVFVLHQMTQYFQTTQKGTDSRTKFSFMHPREETYSPKISEIFEHARATKSNKISLSESIRILHHYDVPTDTMRELNKREDLQQLGKKFSYPIDLFIPQTNSIYRAESQRKGESLFDTHVSGTQGDYFAKVVYSASRSFRVVITKDTYYEYARLGFTSRELERMSFGYRLHIAPAARTVSSDVEAILPIGRDRLEDLVRESRLAEEYVSGSKEDVLDLQDLFLRFVRKVTQIPLDYNQIQEIDLHCVVSNGELSVNDCSIRLNLYS